MREDEYLHLRSQAANKHMAENSMGRSGSQHQLKTLFSQNDPQLYFHKSPAVGKQMPNLNKDNPNNAVSPYARTNGSGLDYEG